MHKISHDHTLRRSVFASQSENEACIKDLGYLSEITAISKVILVRIAVLDIGRSMETPILNQHGQEHRLTKNWKSWVDKTFISQDEHDYGICISPLLLRITPKDEMHVARVAHDVNDLQNATQTITNVSLTTFLARLEIMSFKAIHYTVASRDADIISVLFGL